MACLGCPIKDREATVDFPWKETLDSSRFFSAYPRLSHYNLYGGDPVTEPSVLGLAVFLAKSGKSIGLWTPLNCTTDQMAQLAPFISTWYVYVPVTEPDEYQLRVGQQTWSSFLEQLSVLISEKRKIVLVSRIDETSIGYLPYLYEFAYYKNLPLILLMTKPSGLTKEQRRHVSYFATHKSISVYTTRYSQNACSGAPTSIPFYPLQKAWNTYQNWKLF